MIFGAPRIVPSLTICLVAIKMHLFNWPNDYPGWGCFTGLQSGHV